MENLVILGSTGSIGKQTIEVLRKKPGYFKIFGLAAKDEIEILSSQIKEFNPEIVSVADEKTKNKLSKIFPRLKVYLGEKGLIELSSNPKVNSLVFATSGIVCLRPLIEAIKNKKRLLVANKEIIITAGEIINKYINEYKSEFLPLDSEHSAIFQCLKGENNSEVKNLILTCSGGPFKDSSKEDLEKVTVKEVLSHPVWKMGPKITVDSASLLNKGFEVLEAHYIFKIPLEKIKVVVHPECIIHSMVEFQDGSIKALLSVPDMRLPIQYALFHPKRLSGFLEPLNLVKVKSLSFFEPDTEKFPCLKLAYKAGEIGETMPAALVFADEIAVSKFLENKIKFSEIPEIIEKILTSHHPILKPQLDDIFKVQDWVYKQLKD
jgi:1-deoxy-D-xylulose-5-phosphate reductoisomerase